MLLFAFSLAAVALFLQGVLLPGFSIFAYAPWIALVNLRCSFPRALWLSLLAGVFIDLLSDHPFAIHAISYTAAAAFLFRLRKHFLFEKPLHLGIYSTLISATTTLFTFFLLFLFDRRIPFAGIWVFSDLLAMPIADGVYAVVWFSGPLALFVKLRRQWVLFWLKKRNPSPTSP